MDDKDKSIQNENENNRLRRSSSSSMISSTTSPLIPIRAMNRPSFLNHPRGGEEDELQPSSSTSSFNPASRGGRGTIRSSSPLGSPDSTYWGPSSVSNSYQQRGGPSNNSSSNSSVVQDPCVVSSSTADDIPPSPYSPHEESSSHNVVSHRKITLSPVVVTMPPPPPSSSSSSNHSISIPTQPELGQGSNNSSQDVSQQNNKIIINASSYSSSSSTSNFSFTSSMSPLRSKIKKASSFERFSAQAQASSNSSSNNQQQQLISVSNNNESSGSSSSIQESNSSIMNPTVNGPPRFWDYGTSTTSPPKANFVSSLHDSGSSLTLGTNKPYHIKKLVARLANALELERLEAAAALAASEVNAQSGGGSGDIVSDAGETSSSSGVCNNNNNSESVIIPSEPLMRRQLSQSPLNLTESSTNPVTIYTDSNSHSSNSSSGLPIPPRNPVISTKNFTKKMPLTPKQKLLHRMLNEIPISSPPPPPPQIQSPPLQQQQSQAEHHQLLLASLQQQQHSSNQPQHLILSDPVHGNGLMDDSSGSPAVNNNNDRYTNALSNYEAFIRSTAGEEFSDSMPKVDETTTDPGNNQIMYDSADGYNYYYGNMNILTDEIFNNNNGSALPSTSSSRLIHSSVIQNGVDDDGIQFHSNNSHPNSHLEFVLGMSSQDDHTHHDRNDIQNMENVEEIQMQQQQFLDPNDLVLAGGKSSIAESTLRNLLMMEPVSRNTTHDEWISAAEYQNRLRMSGNSGNNSNSVVLGGGGSSNSWMMNEWQGIGHRSWQGQGQQPHDEQEEGMDMTMEMEKTTHHSLKRNLHPHSHLHLSHMDEGGNLVTERGGDGLPILTSIPIDLQQSFNNGKIMTDPTPLILNSHHRNVIMDCEDEPVNLVNLEQALVHHHSTTAAQDSEDLSHPQNGPTDLGNSTYGNVCVESNIIFTTTSTTSTTVAGFEPPVTQVTTQPPPSSQPFVEFIPGQDTNIDEKRIIRIKKKKEEILGDLCGGGIDKKPNLIPDRPVQPKSFASLPSLLSLTRMSGNGWGVVTKRNKKISANAKFGPVEGPLKRVLKSDLETLNDTVYPVLLMVDNSGIYQLDRMDDQLTNWMKYVRRARSAEEQNLLVTEEDDGLLYFTTCRDIPSKTELKVGYSSMYAQKYSVPYFPPEQENSSENNDKKGVKKLKRKVEEEKYVCFECDLNCVSIDELNKHLDSAHGEVDGFRRPKKKAIRKFYNSLNNPVDEDVKVKSEAEVESTSKRSLKKKEIERLKREEEENIVESSSPDIVMEDIENPIVEISIPPVQQEASSSSNSVLPPPKIKCYICYKVFATTHRLQKHMIVHSEDNLKPLKCDLCGKRFLTNSALAGHAKSHEGGKSFECPLCEFTTHQLLHLKEHVQSHKNEQNGFSCPHCPKNFSCYSLVRKHIRAFHGPRLYSCEDCTMKFPTPDKLKLHELRHSSFRAYLCAECGRQFKRKDKLTDHTRKTHGNNKPQQSEAEQVRQVLPEPSEPCTVEKAPKPKEILKKIIPRLTEEEISKFTFRCTDCMIGFRRRGMLVNHLVKRHPEIDVDSVPELALPITRTAKHYFCPYCERVYKSSSKRKSHILKNHPGKAVPPQVRGKDLKTLLEEKVGSTTFDLKSEFEGAEMEQIKATVDQVIRKETIVGEIVGTPHGCSFCHRQYATRAKLLQHQRKFHISLMPPEIQTPRPQKNNVKNIEQSEIQHHKGPPIEIENEEERDLLMDDKEEIIVPQHPYGYLITTTGGGQVMNPDLGSLLEPELFMSIISHQNQAVVPALSTGGNSGTRTITLCIPSGMISTTAPTNTNPTNNHNNTQQLISSGINVNGTPILTKTD